MICVSPASRRRRDHVVDPAGAKPTGRWICVAGVRRLTPVVVGVLLTGAAISACGGGPSVAPLSRAARLVVAIRGSLAKQQSVRAALTTLVGGSRESVLSDDGTREGSETITAGSSTVSVVVIGGRAYVTGNSEGLTSIFDMPAADVSEAGSRWIVFPSSSAFYKSFSSVVSVSGVSPAVLPSTRELRGATLTATGGDEYLRWTATSGSTRLEESLEVRSGALALPIKETGVSGSDVITQTFSSWDARLRLAIPRHTIAFSSLTG